MLRITRCMSADGAERYFDEALKRSDYYAKELGLWGGKGAERLQLKGEVEREDFVALVRNRVPRSKGQGRLTARDNTTREEWKLDPVTGQWGWKEVANRQTGYDWTFSVPKSVSLYFASTEDPLVEKLAHQALAATMDEAEARMQCKVRGKGPDGNPRDHDRLTGEMIYSTFVHRESRPIQGRTCPHWHAHVFVLDRNFLNLIKCELVFGSIV